MVHPAASPPTLQPTGATPTASTPPPTGPADEGRRWALRTATAITAVAAVFHLASSAGVVDAYTDSDLDDTATIEAVLLWFLSGVTFASLPVALWWSTRVPPRTARALQAYAGVLVGGLAVASVPVALVARGATGLVTVPQVLGSSLITALIVAGRTPAEATR